MTNTAMNNTLYDQESTETQSPRLKNMRSIRESLKDFSLISQNKAMVQRKLSMHSLTESDSQDTFSLEVEDNTRQSHCHHAELFAEKYDLVRKMGQGSNGVVHRCRKRKSGTDFAAKALTFQDEHLPQLRENFLLLKHLDHANIIQYQALYLDLKRHQCWLVMQLFQSPNLSRVIFSQQGQLRQLVRKVLETLYYLHQKSVTHRDIKPENILYDRQTKNIKLIDFGICRRHKRRGHRTDMLTITGTLYYRAPEMFQGGGYNQKVDIWAAGVLIYKLVTGKTPFQSVYHKQTIRNIQKGEIIFPQAFDKFSPALKGLVSKMLKPNPKDRLSALDSLRDPWFLKSPQTSTLYHSISTHKNSYPFDQIDNEQELQWLQNAKSPIGAVLENMNFVRKINGDEFHCFDSDDDEGYMHRLKRNVRSMTVDLGSIKT